MTESQRKGWLVVIYSSTSYTDPAGSNTMVCAHQRQRAPAHGEQGQVGAAFRCLSSNLLLRPLNTNFRQQLMSTQKSKHSCLQTI